MIRRNCPIYSKKDKLYLCHILSVRIVNVGPDQHRLLASDASPTAGGDPLYLHPCLHFHRRQTPGTEDEKDTHLHALPHQIPHR